MGQLAEAILAEDGEPEDASSILLDDTRSRRASNSVADARDHERQFLVGDDEEDLADEVRSFRSSVSMDDESERSKLGPLLHNTSARTSHLDVTTYGQPSRDEDDEDEPALKKGNSLASKAGTIMVRPTISK